MTRWLVAHGFADAGGGELRRRVRRAEEAAMPAGEGARPSLG